MPAPFELVAGPVDIWLAAPNTADVVINVAPPGAWSKLGVSGHKDYDEGVGVIARGEQTIQVVGGLGATGDRKAFREKEKVIVEVTCLDSTMEAYAHAFNEAVITTLAGPPAEKTIPLLLGGTVQTRALLIRGLLSPYADSASNLQWWIPLCFQSGNPETVYLKGKPVGLKMQFTALQDDTNGMGKLHLPTS